MNYKPDEAQLMAYLYGELQGEDKLNVERYLADHPEVRAGLESLSFVQKALKQVPDKEVIAPAIVLDNHRNGYFWNSWYGRTMLGIAASLTLIIMAGKLTGLQIRYSDSSLTIAFGSTGNKTEAFPITRAGLTATEVQAMIDRSLVSNNESVELSLQETQQQLDKSIRKSLATRNDAVFNELVRKTAQASEQQVREFALALQADNAQMIKDYLTLNSSDQRKYIEELLVDFARYLEQQHRNDLQVLQARLNTIEQNTDVFKYETEQILTSIISSVDQSNSLVTKN